MRPLVLVGAGGFARETAEVVHALNAVRPAWDLLGFVDDHPELAGATVDGLPVLGPIDLVRHDLAEASVVVCTGHPGNYFSRKRIVERLALPVERFATLVHPAAVVPRSACLGPGTVLLANVVVTTGLAVGAHVAVMPAAVLTHDDVVGDYATFGAGAKVAGRVAIGEGAYIGSGAMIRESLTIGEWALIGMGAVVTADVPPYEVWAGVPARFLRKVAVP
jgi:sugar O-acyltransferase (sialic acid O-acetyltransferase NeuD family)